MYCVNLHVISNKAYNFHGRSVEVITTLRLFFTLPYNIHSKPGFVLVKLSHSALLTSELKFSPWSGPPR